MRKHLLHVLIISIFSLVLFACSLVSAQSHQLADEYWDQAQELKKQGKYLDAAKMFEESAQAEKTSSSPRMVALSVQLNNAGYYYFMVGQYDKAIKFYEEALAIARKLEMEDKVAICLNNIGLIYDSWGQYDNAIKFYEEALAIDKRLGREAQVAIIQNRVSDYFLQASFDR